MPIIVLLWKLAKNYYNLHYGFTNHLQHDPTVVQFFPSQAKPSSSNPSARRLRSEDRDTGHTSLNSRLPQKNTHCLSRHCHLFQIQRPHWTAFAKSSGSACSPHSCGGTNLCAGWLSPFPKTLLPLSFGSRRAKTPNTVGSQEWKTYQEKFQGLFIIPYWIYSYVKHLAADAKTLLQQPRAGDFRQGWNAARVLYTQQDHRVPAHCTPPPSGALSLWPFRNTHSFAFKLYLLPISTFRRKK